MGIYVGDEEELTPKSWENPAGFFERRDARKICDALLHQSGADWWKVSSFHADNVNHEVVRSQRGAIRDLVQRLDTHGPWALKEPRLCLLFPIFLNSLSNPLAIIALRHPVEVARSLRRRNGFSIQAGLALWEAYTVSLLRVSNGIDHVFVNYHELTRDPRSTLEVLASELTMRGFTALDVRAAAESIQPSLQRERLDESRDRGLLTSAQQALWVNLTRTRAWQRLTTLSPAALSVLQEFESDEGARREARTTIKTLSAKVAGFQALESERKVAVDQRTAELPKRRLSSATFLV